MELFETNRFLVFCCVYNKRNQVVFIDKKSKKTFITYRESSDSGILNDLDGGIMFDIVLSSYYAENNQEYIIGLLDTYKLKTHIASEDFKNFNPKYPKMKQDLNKLASSLKETDNPILMLVRLKK